MLEVLDRDLNARIIRWKEGTLSTIAPEILYLDMESFPAPDEASLILVEEEGGHRILTSGGEKGPLLKGGVEYPLSYLRSEGLNQLVTGDSSLTVRSAPINMPSKLEVDGPLVRLDGAFELRRDPRGLVESIVRLREAVGNSVPIYAPGIMEVGNLALLCYMGIDLFDSSLVLLQSARGRVMLPDRNIDAFQADWLLEEPTCENILDLNLRSLSNELFQVRWAISNGKLRDMVETRVTSDPWAVSVLRLFDLDGYDHQEVNAPVVGERVACNTKQALHRPDVERWRRRIYERYQPPVTKKVLLLLPCSARKPYSTSRTHKTFRRAIDSVGKSHLVHEVIVTSPLGVVPRELELFYPAAHYDIPVTGHWDCFETGMIRDLIRHIASFGYEHIIFHMDEPFFPEGFDFVQTSSGTPTSRESLANLCEALELVCGPLEPKSRAEDRIATMSAITRFQFGPGGEILMEGAEVVGRHPRPRIVEEGKQLGMLSPERGMISLTIDGARKLGSRGVNLVHIGDFELKGNLFAVGVERADLHLRRGDEAIVIRGDEVVGVGVASMNGPEMMDLSRGEAVRIRHTG